MSFTVVTNRCKRVLEIDQLAEFGSHSGLTAKRYVMFPENRIPTHPGAILLAEFRKPIRISQVAFAKHVGVLLQRIHEIVRGVITPDTAWRFVQALGTTPEYWMNLQIALARPANKVECMRPFAD